MLSYHYQFSEYIDNTRLNTLIITDLIKLSSKQHGKL
jgi:hypothetical protein